MMNWLIQTTPNGATYLQAIILSAAVILSLAYLTSVVFEDFMDMWHECFPKHGQGAKE